jgi:hypothetical protein
MQTESEPDNDKVADEKATSVKAVRAHNPHFRQLLWRPTANSPAGQYWVGADNYGINVSLACFQTSTPA